MYKLDLERTDDDATLLEALRTHLTPQAQQSLDALATTSVVVDSPKPDPESCVNAFWKKLSG